MFRIICCVVVVAAVCVYFALDVFLGAAHRVGAVRNTVAIAVQRAHWTDNAAGLGGALLQIESSGVELYVAPSSTEKGEERQHVVMAIHGGPSVPSGPWPQLDEVMSRVARVVYPHQRGAGRSSKPIDRFDATSGFYPNFLKLEGTLGVGAQVSDLEVLRHALTKGREQKVHLVGHSFGGLLATFYAAEFPENVASLTLISPANCLSMPPPNNGLFGLIRDRLPTASDQTKFDEFVSSYLDYSATGAWTKSEKEMHDVNRQMGVWYARAVKNDSLKLRLEERLNEGTYDDGGGWAPHAMFMSLGMWYDHTAQLQAAFRRVVFPVHILHGAKDIQQLGDSVAYAKLFPGHLVTTTVLQQSDHFSVLWKDGEEGAEEFRRALEGFFKLL